MRAAARGPARPIARRLPLRRACRASPAPRLCWVCAPLDPTYGSASLSPGGAGCAMLARRCSRRGARIQHPAWQRSAPGRVALVLEGPRSRRPAVTVAVEAPAMAAECGDRREAHGRRRARKSRPPAAACSGAQNRRHAGAERRPGDPGKGSRKPDGASREASSQRPSGPAGTGPGSPRGARVPVAPSCPAPGRRGKDTARARCEAIGRRQ